MLGCILKAKDALLLRNEFAEYRQKCRFSCARTATDEDIFACEDVVFEMIRQSAVESPGPNQIFHLKMTCVELADCERHSSQTTRWNDGSDAATIGQPRVEDGFRFGDVIPQTPRDIFHGDHKRPLTQGHTGNLLKESLFLDKHTVGAIDHDLADRIVEDQVFDGLQKRQDHFESVHHKTPYASCFKDDTLGSLY